ncbi:MAG: PhzF family phenazine biosynthesis protein [Deltaproteobacteria bacterium]|nr:PhzF family phenazine biosynthesis protein [Deltaproteobacteria bacterium]
MRFPLYQVDAFTREPFKGNPAAVVPLETWIADATLQSIATENNLSETAFFLPPDHNGVRPLRWFTPTTEINLCGHATLASAWIILTVLDPEADGVRFTTRSGELRVFRHGDALRMDLPSSPPRPCAPPDGLAEMLGAEPLEVLEAEDLLVRLSDEATVHGLTPDFRRIAALPWEGVIATAPGEDTCHFVSRFFAPGVGIPEDPVTGAAHCTLTPYWAQRLERTVLTARQVSERGGEIECRMVGDRVHLVGNAVTVLEGTFRF